MMLKIELLESIPRLAQLLLEKWQQRGHFAIGTVFDRRHATHIVGADFFFQRRQRCEIDGARPWLHRKAFPELRTRALRILQKTLAVAVRSAVVEFILRA